MNHDVYKELLQFLAFSEDEIEKELEGLEYACERTGVTEADVRFAIDEWLPKNWCTQYVGVRKALGGILREFIDTCQTPKLAAAGKKLVYGILPAYSNLYYAFKYAAGEDVYIGFPDIVLTGALNGIFHKASPFFDRAEEEGFTHGCRHCPLNKMRLNAYTSGIIGAPDVIWSWGFNCDEGPKTDEMIQNLTGKKWPYVISRAPHDVKYGVDDDLIIPKVEFCAEEFRRGFNEVCGITGIEVAPDDFTNANKDLGRVSFKVAQLTQMACKADPPVLTGNVLTLLSSIQLFPYNRGLKYMEDAVDTLLVEVRAAMKNGEGILPKGAPKVGSYFVPIAVPWVDRLFLENGVCTTYSLITTVVKKQLNPNYISDDPFMIMAEMWLRRGSIQNMGSDVNSMIEKAQTYAPDGVIMGFFDFDRYLGAHQKVAAKIVEETTGVPHFYMESDFYDDRDYSDEALKTRIESICQILKMRKEMSE